MQCSAVHCSASQGIADCTARCTVQYIAGQYSSECSRVHCTVQISAGLCSAEHCGVVPFSTVQIYALLYSESTALQCNTLHCTVYNSASSLTFLKPTPAKLRDIEMPIIHRLDQAYHGQTWR